MATRVVVWAEMVQIALVQTELVWVLAWDSTAVEAATQEQHEFVGVAARLVSVVAKRGVVERRIVEEVLDHKSKFSAFPMQ